MDAHPGGKEVTLKLLELARIGNGKRIIDLGAGNGGSVSLLKEMRVEVTGIDLGNVKSPVVKGDMCALDYECGSFDAALAECSFSVCGDLSVAIAESARVLKGGGKLLISDVYYKAKVPQKSVFPNAVTIEGFEKLVRDNGLQVLFFQDISKVLKEYYIESIWKDECCLSPEEARNLKNNELGYFMMICVKEIKEQR